MKKIGLAVVLATVITPRISEAQKPVEGLLGNYSKMLGESLESARRFCNYHGGALIEGETENAYECHKGNNKTGRGVILKFHFTNAYGSYEVLGIKIDAVLSRSAGNNAYAWIRQTNPWDRQSACKIAGHIKKCRRLYYRTSRGSAFTEHRLDFYWHTDGNVVINGALILGLN